MDFPYSAMIFSICSSVNSSDFKNSRFIYMTSIGYVFLRGYDHEPLCSLTSTNGKKTKNNIRNKQFNDLLRSKRDDSHPNTRFSVSSALSLQRMPNEPK